MSFVIATVEINESSLVDKIQSLLNDETMLEITKIFAEMCDPYVPYLTGNLSGALQNGSMTVDAEGIHYNADYADYQYYGTHFRHNLTVHPQATALWDRVMMSEQGDLLRERITEVLARRAKELYG